MGNCISSSSVEMPGSYPEESIPGEEERDALKPNGCAGSISAATTAGTITSSSGSTNNRLVRRRRRRRRRHSANHHSDDENDGCDDAESCASTCSPLLPSLSPVHRQLPPNAERVTVREVYDGNSLRLVNDVHVKLLGIHAPELNGRIEKPYSKEAKSYLQVMCLGDECCEATPDVWISYDLSLGEQDSAKDPFGRLLAFLWVRQRWYQPQTPESTYGYCRTDHGGSSGFLCVNEGLVAEGLAIAYSLIKPIKFGGKQQQQQQIPSLYTWERLVSLQKFARRMRRGVWTDFVDQDVLRLSTRLLSASSSSSFSVSMDRNKSEPSWSSYHLLNCHLLSKINHAIECRASEALDGGFHPCKYCIG